jgi:hypothetical protein
MFPVQYFIIYGLFNDAVSSLDCMCVMISE